MQRRLDSLLSYVVVLETFRTCERSVATRIMLAARDLTAVDTRVLPLPDVTGMT